MFSKPLENIKQRTALLLLGAVLSAAPVFAQMDSVRVSAPVLGWMPSPDGFHLIEIGGVPDSPRAVRTITMADRILGLWSSPDGRHAVLQTSEGVSLFSAQERNIPLKDFTSVGRVSVTWERGSSVFAVCAGDACEIRDSNGARIHGWTVPLDSRAEAVSLRTNLVTSTGKDFVWHTPAGSMPIDGQPAALSFRPGADELWVLYEDGRLVSRDSAGATIREFAGPSDGIGLAFSVDGASLLAATREGGIWMLNTESGETAAADLGAPVQGVWPGPGRFGIRLHDSVKAPIAIFDGDAKVVGWMPAEVAQ